MRTSVFLFICFMLLTGCSNEEPLNTFVPDNDEFDWVIPGGALNGSLNPFPLAKDPVMTPAKDINFISGKSLVAMVSFGGEIRVYPYQFISRFEAVNDKIGEKEYMMTYCPLTQSGLVMQRDFKTEKFTFRASGYLLNNNQVLLDEKTDTYWSQMQMTCIKGKYATKRISTFNYIEVPWKLIEDYFPEALVFTSSSIQSKSAYQKKGDLTDGAKVYGIVQPHIGKDTKVYIYKYEDFKKNTILKERTVSNNQVLIIGNEELHFITSYINDSNARFKAVTGEFPVIMEDSDSNRWNIFGVAVSGPRKGEQLESKPGFAALWWGWKGFYKDFTFDHE